jgi:replicative DNA helicase
MNELSGGLVPNDVEAEAKVLGAAMLSPGAVERVAGVLNHEHFFYRPHFLALTAIGILAGQQKPVTTETVVRTLQGMKKGNSTALSDLGGADGITRMVEGVNPEEFEFWMERVETKRRQRALQALQEKVRLATICDPEDLKQTLFDLEGSLTRISDDDEATETIGMAEAMKGVAARVEEYIANPNAITGLETGWAEFDKTMDGQRPGEVTMWYAPSSRFKSLVLQNIGWRYAKNGIPGYWFTTEMSATQVMERVLQLEAGMNIRWLRQDGVLGDYAEHLRAATKRLATFPILQSDRTDIDISLLRSEVMRAKRYKDIKYVIVDLVDMVSSRRLEEGSVQHTAAIMKQLKDLSKRAEVHINIVSHVSKGERSMRNAADLDPEEMKGSSSKYQDADNCISIMPVRPGEEGWVGLTREGIRTSLRRDGGCTLLLSITKNRMGDLARIEMELDYNAGGHILQPQSKTTYPVA